MRSSLPACKHGKPSCHAPSGHSSKAAPCVRRHASPPPDATNTRKIQPPKPTVRPTADSRFSHLARFLAPWRSGAPSLDDDEQEAPVPVRVRTLDPMTGRVISPLTAAALCVKPRGQMTPRQAASVDALKTASAEFTAMRRLAMRFRGLLRGGTAEGLDAWLIDARTSWIYAMQRFAKRIRQDPEGCAQRCLGAVEQRANRRADQQTEDP